MQQTSLSKKGKVENMYLRIIGIGFVLVGSFARPTSAQTVTCAPADSFGIHIRDIVREVANPADTRPTGIRAKMGITAAPDSEVVLVLADSLCAVAGAALDNSEGIAPTSRELHVVKIGTSSFAVVDRRTVVGLRGFHIFSSTWVYKGYISMEG